MAKATKPDVFNNIGLDLDVVNKYIALYGLKIIGAIIIFVIGIIIAKILRRVLKKVLDKSRVDPTLTSFISHTIYVVMFVFVIIATLNNIGINTTSLATVLAAAGLAISLAFQGSLSNVAAGITLIILRPFRVGHTVEIAGIQGNIVDIDMMTTELRTADNKRVIIPNSQIINGKIINEGHNPTLRIDLVIGISFEEDLEKVKTIIQNVVSAEPRVMKEPDPFIGVLDFGNTRINLGVRVWVKNEDNFAAKVALYEKIHTSLRKEGIIIPSKTEPKNA